MGSTPCLREALLGPSLHLDQGLLTEVFGLILLQYLDSV